ncbi:response regulator transcription factor [Acetivibrio cellulolyticus]|uniref:response regulator transcription factor n=1 Tax=Acetivibrio cellulolyticus TaxID=35830 RepID=UPI0001E3056A|nr:response regulator transcription factor [Acetivibrio cellulolyticus]
MPQILIVEDDVALSNGIVLAMKKEGFEFIQCFDKKSAEKEFACQKFDLIILDINLPDGSGLDFCQIVRNSSDVPVIFLTANDMEIDVVTGFEIGANDYITKPFSLAILRARILAQLRKPTEKTKSGKYTVNGIYFDFDAMLFTKNGKEIELSKTEQKLLRILLENRGNILTRDTLIDRVWSDGADFVNENALSVTIRRLRNKLEDDPSQPVYIQTVYGMGYTWKVKSDV